MLNLLGNADTGVTSNTFTFTTNDIFIYFSGDFDGATCAIQFKREDNTWVTLADGLITEPSEKVVLLFKGAELRLVTSGGTNPSINAGVEPRVL